MLFQSDSRVREICIATLGASFFVFSSAELVRAQQQSQNSLFEAKAEPASSAETTAKKHFDPIVREIEGWRVHITRAASLLERHQLAKHPSVILHELSHAFHDQILGGWGVKN